MNSCTYNTRPADPRYQRMVNRIVALSGMQHSIEVFESDTPNACATLYKICQNGPQKPIIAYNSDFIAELEQISPWAVYAVFAHEVAHHKNEDLYGFYIANLLENVFYSSKSHQQELNADEFAGWVLAHEGASLYDAMSMYDIFPEEGSFTHPDKTTRKQAMREGWFKGKRSMTPPRKKESALLSPGESLLLGAGALAVGGLLFAALLDD